MNISTGALAVVSLLRFVLWKLTQSSRREELTMTHLLKNRTYPPLFSLVSYPLSFCCIWKYKWIHVFYDTIYVSVFMTHLCFYLCVWWRDTVPSLHHLNINLMNAAFNVTAKYNTAHIPPEREPRGCSGGGGEWVEWRKDSKMRRGDREILQG